ncbi:hypothetical protein HZB02_02170 [Candidatus Woesearchaeota archaeon]|nr:hypothetical protein [Candidatus Woesearchaeota archaeon]
MKTVVLLTLVAALLISGCITDVSRSERELFCNDCRLKLADLKINCVGQTITPCVLNSYDFNEQNTETSCSAIVDDAAKQPYLDHNGYLPHDLEVLTVSTCAQYISLG